MTRMLCLSFMLMVTFLPLAVAQPTLQTRSGAVSGKFETASGNVVETFKGIPFAAPPTGALRWRAPAPENPWPGTLDGNSFQSACVQPKNSFIEVYPVPTSEDCLYLNVYRPANTTSKDRLPIMIFFHGGSYVYGAASFLAYEATERIAQSKNVIIITANYRLQALGFLGGALLRDPTDNSTGNWGLKDQRAAMKWVQDSADLMGGDKNIVTIFGESAGAGSVSNHMVSPSSWPYFHRAIMESGPIDASWVSMPMNASESNLEEILKRLNCTNATSKLDCLRSKNATEISSAGDHTKPSDDPGGVDLIGWSPVVDGIELPDAPRRLLREGKVNHVPVLLGTNHDEGTEFVKPKGNKMTKAAYTIFLNTHFGPKLAPAVLAHYPLKNYKSPFLAAVDALGDEAMTCPARETARYLSDAKLPVYLYFFVHELNWLKLDPKVGKNLGVFHGSDLIFVFDKAFAFLGKEEKALANTFGEWWTSFATHGAPTSPAGEAWPAYNRTNDEHMNIDVGTSKPLSGLKTTVCDFWATTPLTVH